MADPYTRFGYSMPPFLGARRQPIRAPSQMGFQPFMPPTAEGGLMPQSAAEAADLQQQGQGAENMVSMALPFALGGPMGRAAGWAGPRIWELLKRFPEAAAGAGAMGGTCLLYTSPSPPRQA